MSAVANSHGLGDLFSGNITSIGNWADAVEQESKLQNGGCKFDSKQKGKQSIEITAQRRIETDVKNGIETITEIVDDKENGRSRVITTFKKITKRVPRAIADRKKWKKFGAAVDDGPGPNIKTTYVTEEVRMQFVGGRADQEQEAAEEKKLEAMKSGGSRIHCRICKADDHWSVHCPYKEMYQVDDDTESADRAVGTKAGGPSAGSGRYVAPYMRGERGGTGPGMERRSDDFTCRVTNLPEDSDTLDDDLRAMFGSVGRIERFYLARDKTTGKPKGFAFITYSNRMDAESAIQRFSGYKMQHLILKVEWTK